jgi:hypothetical protein
MGPGSVGGVPVELEPTRVPASRLHLPAAREGMSLNGRLKITVVDPESGEVVDEREGYNVVCTTGWTVLAQAMVWSGIQDQALNLGITSPTYLTPLYGAVGSGTGTVSKSDTALFAELARTTVGAGASTPATSTISALSTWMFFFSTPPTAWTVGEAGVFANATSGANSGSMIDHWSFSPAISVPSTNALVFQMSLEWGP